MKYTLAQNAVSSLHIAIENFKLFYYYASDCSISERDEYIKICITFLENSIELLLKVILADNDPLSIYQNSNCKTIRTALERVDSTVKLEDILITLGDFKTINYSEAVERYNAIFHKSDKLYRILKKLGESRNSITHFGVDRSTSFGELMIEIFNAFDAIYNYLYPQITNIESIEHYFTDDELFVDTVHGIKPLFNEDFIYNNIIDFLDELLETAWVDALKYRLSDPNNKINDFYDLMRVTLADKKFTDLFKKKSVEIKFYEKEYISHFEILKDGVIFKNVFMRYSCFFNVTAFCDDDGRMEFLIVHDKMEMYIYRSQHYRRWPECDEAEPDMLWENDFKNNMCEKLVLSKRNLIRAFDKITDLNFE